MLSLSVMHILIIRGTYRSLLKKVLKDRCTVLNPTSDLMEIMLLDSAKLQEEEAAYAFAKGYSKHANPKPLNTTDDAKQVFSLLKTYDFGEKIRIHGRIEILFQDAGHLLGAAITEIFIKGAYTK